MRVCLLSREYPPDTAFGGIATFSYHLAKGLKELGHDVTVVALAQEETGTKVQEGITVHRIKASETVDGLELAPRYMPYSAYLFKTATALWTKFNELHNEAPFDVIDAPDNLADGLLPAITKLCPLSVRLYTPHFKFMESSLNEIDNAFDHQFVALSERLCMLSADALTCPSEDLANFVSTDLNINNSAINIIRNPIDVKQFQEDGPKLKDFDSSNTVLYIGRLEQRKGVLDLINAIPKIIAQCPETKFMIVGSETTSSANSSSALDRIKALASKLGVLDRIHFKERVPLTELASIYRSADITIVPSLYDNSPYTCVEAMACGKAVVGTSSGGMKEYIEHEVSGLVIPPGQPEEIQKAIVRLLQNPEERKRLGKNARARVEQNYDHVKIAKETEALYLKARETYAIRASARLYHKNHESILADTETLLQSFDQMLCNQMKKHSLRFRLAHLFQSALKRPKLTSAKLLSKTLKSVGSILPVGKKPNTISNITDKLDDAIQVKSVDQDRIDITIAQESNQALSTNERLEEEELSERTVHHIR